MWGCSSSRSSSSCIRWPRRTSYGGSDALFDAARIRVAYTTTATCTALQRQWRCSIGTQSTNRWFCDGAGCWWLAACCDLGTGRPCSRRSVHHSLPPSNLRNLPALLVSTCNSVNIHQLENTKELHKIHWAETATNNTRLRLRLNRIVRSSSHECRNASVTYLQEPTESPAFYSLIFLPLKRLNPFSLWLPQKFWYPFSLPYVNQSMKIWNILWCVHVILISTF